jgi:SHS family lactate transporter-like MFS transporter
VDSAATPNSASGNKGQFHAVLAGFLGWTLDAFDFFIVVFLFDRLAAQFGVTKKDIVFTTAVTLAMRPVGALLFGLLADRFGRRIPLMGNVIYFSIIELLCGFAPSFKVFLILRALFGIGMGGEWGVGAKRVFDRFSSGLPRCQIPLACLGMAADVLDRRSPRPAGAVH